MDRLTPEKRGWLMSRVRSKDTTTELTIRRLLFASGFRYRLHDSRLPGRPDLVFRGRHKVIFVNGCFWHGHEDCRYARLPKTRVEFWQTKVERNKIRDRENIALLTSAGWTVLTVWQCELKNIEQLANRLYDFLESN